tara:strand:+ start:328 stop:747 length:420 start_codon:yes stop_codon:yes gene_type:complete
MYVPTEIMAIINDFADNGPATLRTNWREGSSINAILTRDHWWKDYMSSWGFWGDASWVEWCKDKMIIGPPRHRSSREEAELDEDYLTMEDIIRHCRPWSKTWPDPDDHSWCTGPYRTTLPDWVKKEYCRNVKSSSAAAE